jgi:hypothetical protein
MERTGSAVLLLSANVLLFCCLTLLIKRDVSRI